MREKERNITIKTHDLKIEEGCKKRGEQKGSKENEWENHFNWYVPICTYQ